jgi:lipoprotein NlpI
MGVSLVHRPARLLAAALLLLAAAVVRADEPAGPRQYFDEAVRLFFEARPVESARLFDTVVRESPSSEPQLWQRGLALYYAGRYTDGRRQFESHRTVNPGDVENVAWHFACVARGEDVAAARAALLPVGDDPRVPMRQILGLFAGRESPEAVLEAAERGAAADRRNQLCYAHLYLGLYFDAIGDDDSAKRHILLAAGPFSMDHYMGRVAGVHARVRGWPLDAEPEAGGSK